MRLAREQWQQWALEEQRLADKGLATQESAATGRRTVEALDLEIATGVPHCVCCLKPMPHVEQDRYYRS